MLKLIKYLKRSIIPILAILALLVVQAMCDLALPDYTSVIVNVGIQQNGIESAAPEYLSKTTKDHLGLFLTQDQKQQLDNSYTELSQEEFQKTKYYNQELFDKQLEQNPDLATETFYKRNKLSEQELSDLETMLAKPVLINDSINQASLNQEDSSQTSENAEKMQQMFSQLTAAIPPQALQNATSLWDILELVPEQQMQAILEEMGKQFDDMPDSILAQSAIPGIKAEYDAIGLDTGTMQIHYIIFSGLQMLSIALTSMLATVIVTFLAARVAASLSRELRKKVFTKVVSFSNTELDHFSTASLITRSTNDIQQIQLVMVMLLRIVFYAPIIGVGGVLKVTGTNGSMTWVIGIAVLAILVIVGIMFAVAMPKFKKMQKLVDRLNLVTREILTGLPVIRAFSTQKYEEKRFDKANKDLTGTNLFVNRVMSCMMPAMMFIMNSIAILVVWVGSQGVDAGTMQVGDMMAYIQYTMQIIMAFLMISMISVMLPRASVAANRIQEVLDTDVCIKDVKAPEKLDQVKGELTFQDVSFRYPNASEDALSHIAFTAKPGQTTAIIGSTGSGKSTLLNLIPRFYDVTEGQVLLDGVDIKEISQHFLRDQLGYVPQKGVLFTGTVQSNINYGVPEEDTEHAKKAAEIAQATEFIDKLPKEYDAPIAEGGTNVSGGQKQRLSIARAIAKNPKIYLFDDSFSALDFKTDVALRKALKKQTGNSTVIIVAQRISTILNAEQILVLDEGKIVGKGTHKELMQTCEVYRQIASSQLSEEELDHE